MGRDVRAFQVSLEDDALIWQVLAAVETAAKSDASSHELEVECSVEVEHATGKYDRDTVAEAQETSQRNDFRPDRVSLQLSLAGTDAQPGGVWIRAYRFHARDPLTVEVVLGRASEVDRVYSVLRESAHAIDGAAVDADRAEPRGGGRDTRTLQLSVADDATLWQVLAAVEKSATDDATGRGLDVSTEVDVEHATGKYTRDTVADSQETSRRNDFAPGLVRLQLSLAQTIGRYWVQVLRYRRSDPLSVEVTERSAPEADRILDLLREAAVAAGARVDADRVKQSSWRDRDTRKFQIPLPDDDATLWQVLQTIEASAQEEAATGRQSLAIELRVGDASGEYTRNTVAEAKDTLVRNDMVPRQIDFRLTFKPLGDTTSWSLSDEGITVRRYAGDRPLSVEIAMNDEAELNRLFSTLQETFAAELRTSPRTAAGLGPADQDTRKFLVDTAADDGLLWRVLEAVASAAEDAARHDDRTVAATLSIGHSTGEYVRSTVGEAKATSQKNGFPPETVDFELFRIGPDADLTFRRLDPWLRIFRRKIGEPLVIEVLSGNEIEVSGVFNKLQDHVKAAIQSTQDGTNNAVLVPPSSSMPPAPRWKRIINHGWTVEVVGGLAAAVGGGLIIAWIVSR